MNATYALAYVILALIILYAAAYLTFEKIMPFNRERKYIKMEINRSQSKEEYEYWKSELKLLYLKSIPLIGKKYRRE